jgi:ribosomal-protein-alanine N-acetyltransferase
MVRPIEIRKFRWAELDRIERIEKASFGKDAYDRNLFAELFHRCGDLFLVGVRRGAVCGYMVTCVKGERAEVVSIAVDPAARGRGAGSALMKSALLRLRRRRVARLVLMVKVNNEAARAFYSKYGFEKVRIVRKYYEDGSDGLLMARAVDAKL